MSTSGGGRLSRGVARRRGALDVPYSDEWVEDKVIADAIAGSRCECCGITALSDMTAALLSQCTDLETDAMEAAKAWLCVGAMRSASRVASLELYVLP